MSIQPIYFLYHQIVAILIVLDSLQKRFQSLISLDYWKPYDELPGIFWSAYSQYCAELVYVYPHHPGILRSILDAHKTTVVHSANNSVTPKTLLLAPSYIRQVCPAGGGIKGGG